MKMLNLIFFVILLLKLIVVPAEAKIEVSEVSRLDPKIKKQLYENLVEGMYGYSENEFVDLIEIGLSDNEVQEYALGALFWSAGKQHKHGLSGSKKLNYHQIINLKSKLINLSESVDEAISGLSAGALAYVFSNDAKVEKVFLNRYENTTQFSRKIGYLKLLNEGRFSSRQVNQVMINALIESDVKALKYISDEQKEFFIKEMNEIAINGIARMVDLHYVTDAKYLDQFKLILNANILDAEQENRLNEAINRIEGKLNENKIGQKTRERYDGENTLNNTKQTLELETSLNNAPQEVHLASQNKDKLETLLEAESKPKRALWPYAVVAVVAIGGVLLWRIQSKGSLESHD